MRKRLEDMTLEELWQLFPIVLTKHNDDWDNYYKEEYEYLKTILPDDLIINHIGSTAIKDIWAKPIIDILIEAKNIESLKKIKNILTNNGYLLMSETDTRISLNKGYTIKGFSDKVFHIHLRLIGDNIEIKFKDYLNDHYSVRKEYEKLKLSLWKKFEYNRDAYTNSKTEFINNINNIINNS